MRAKTLVCDYAPAMNEMFEEIAWEQTSIGELVLRRRRSKPDGEDIWEIKLNDGYLMSSQFVEGEIALADIALAMIEGNKLDVIIGGLGLGYTAQAALHNPRVVHLTVVELIPEVIEWHHNTLLPLAKVVAGQSCDHVKQPEFAAGEIEPLLKLEARQADEECLPERREHAQQKTRGQPATIIACELKHCQALCQS